MNSRYRGVEEAPRLKRRSDSKPRTMKAIVVSGLRRLTRGPLFPELDRAFQSRPGCQQLAEAPE
jgi:hypothetical protein